MPDLFPKFWKAPQSGPEGVTRANYLGIWNRCSTGVKSTPFNKMGVAEMPAEVVITVGPIKIKKVISDDLLGPVLGLLSKPAPADSPAKHSEKNMSAINVKPCDIKDITSIVEFVRADKQCDSLSDEEVLRFVAITLPFPHAPRNAFQARNRLVEIVKANKHIKQTARLKVSGPNN